MEKGVIRRSAIMAGDKYVVAAMDNPMQINVRNILSPYGYVFIGNCSDTASFMRLIRSFHPDFAVVDARLPLGEFRNTIETIDDEMLCACILLGNHRDDEMMSLIEKSKTISFCPTPLNRDLLVHTADLSLQNYRRISGVYTKLKEMTENYETRKAIDRAKWILIDRYGISESEAYEKMRKKSMDNRISLKAVADLIIFSKQI